VEQSISRGLAYAPYADMVWCETGKPDLGSPGVCEGDPQARQARLQLLAVVPAGKVSTTRPSEVQHDWRDGPRYQFITGRPTMWFNMFDLAQDYAQRGMSAYVEKVQEPEFAARDRGYTFVSHQQEVGTGYFDDVTTVIQGGVSSVTALTGSTEEEQFH
jgi:isocitrate lyase